jgi:hypothetical protein
MATPLNLGALGIDGARKPIDVKATEGLILPFTRGESPLIVGPGGAVAAESTPEAKALIRANPADADFYSSIGRPFRSFAAGSASI